MRISQLSGLALFALALCACETTLGPPETLGLRSAERYGARVGQTVGSSQGVPCGLDRSPIQPRLEPAVDETVAGFDNRRTEGGYAPNDPTACDRWRMNEYTGSFVFNFDDLPDAVIVERAVLTIDRGPTIIPWPAERRPATSNCAPPQRRGRTITSSDRWGRPFRSCAGLTSSMTAA